MNRRQMMKAFPALAAAATAVAHAMPAEAQAVTQQTPKALPPYKGRLRPGVIALSYRPQLEAKEVTCEVLDNRYEKSHRSPRNHSGLHSHCLFSNIE
jgi:hypothetical protein